MAIRTTTTAGQSFGRVKCANGKSFKGNKTSKIPKQPKAKQEHQIQQQEQQW